MRAITVKEAAQMMQRPEQFVRMAVQLGKIPGAFATGTKAKRSYYITDEQVINMMKGGFVRNEEE